MKKTYWLVMLLAVAGCEQETAPMDAAQKIEASRRMSEVVSAGLSNAKSNLSYSSYSAPSTAESRPASCYDIGRSYGRTAGRTFRGENVTEADDSIIPPHCRNRSDTAAGIKAGM